MNSSCFVKASKQTRTVRSWGFVVDSSASVVLPLAVRVSYRYTLTHSKTNQSGARRPQDIKPVVGQAARALTAWLEVLEEQGIERRGRIFRRMLRGGFVAGPMTPHAVREIVRRRCELAGLHVDDFSAHSLRSGFLTEAGRRGVPLKAAMDMSGHSSVNTAMGYMRAGELASDPAARLLDDDR